MATAEFPLQFRNRLDQIATYISSETNTPSLSVQALLDTFLALYTDCKASNSQTEHVSNFVQKYDSLISQLQNLRVNTQDFEVIKTLATGAIGKVCLVRGRVDQRVYAMKVLKKMDLLTRREAAFFMEERNALVFAQSSLWITTLYAAFQDEENLYLVMEYASGGSLRALINNRETTMEEKEARFYIAEILLALSELHSFNFVHRDVKPENCLIDASGHIKLADFGSCMRLTDTRRVNTSETVGTPDYISPEILRAHEGNVSYGKECDWWSLGIIMYELLFDEVPFYSESLMETYSKIMDHEKYFAFPEDIEVSEEALDLMKKLICKKEERLGRNGANEIRQHPWFKGFDWDTVREVQPPFIPELSGPDDTRYFEDEEGEHKKVTTRKVLPKTKDFTGQNLPFIGYTYVQNTNGCMSWSKEFNPPKMIAAPIDNGRVQELEKQAQDLKSELTQIKLQLSTATAAKQTAEEACAEQKKKLEKEQTQRTDMQLTLSNLEKEKAKLEADLKEIRYRHEHDIQDRDELAGKLTQLKRSLDQEIKSKSEMQGLQDERDRLAKQVKQLQTEIDEERQTIKTHESAAVEATRAKTLLELDIEKLSRKLEDEKTSQKQLQTQLDSLQSKLDEEANKRRELEGERSQLVLKTQKLEADFGACSESLKSETDRIESLKERINALEKEKAVTDVEMEAARQKIKDLVNDKDQLTKSISELENAERQTKSGAMADIQTLKAELDQATKARSDLSQELSEIKKQKALQEVEVQDLQMKLKVEVDAQSQLRNKLAAVEAKAFSQIQQIQVAEETQQRTEAQRRALEAELEKTRSSLNTTTQNLQESDQKLHELEKNNALLQTDNDDLSSRYNKEVQARQQLETRLAGVENDVSSERKAKLQMESLYNEAKRTIEDLQHNTESLSSKIASIKEQQTRSIRENEDILAKLRSEYSALETKYSQEEQQRLAAEKTLVDLRSQISSLEAERSVMTEKILTAKQEYEMLNADNINLRHQLMDEQHEKELLRHKTYDLEHANAILREQLDEKNPARLTKSMDNIKTDAKSIAPSDKGEKPKLKFRNVFFRTQQQRLEQERAMQRIHEAEEEMKNRPDYGAGHSRRVSGGSSTSSYKSSQTKLSLSDIPVMYFDPTEGLKGFLKVPKEKVKKGWARKYALVRDFQLYLYAHEKDAENGVNPTSVINIKTEFFLAKPVAQNELIHASSKDIDSIFSIASGKLHHVSTEPTHTSEQGTLVSSHSTATLGSATVPDLQKKITKTQADIALEEKMNKATERILEVATAEHQRASAQQQLEASRNRLTQLRTELTKLVDLLHTMQASSEEPVPAQQVNPEEYNMESYEEDVAYYRKELEKQRDSLHKLMEATPPPLNRSSPTKSSHLGSNSEGDLHSLERTAVRLKEDLDILRSGDRDLIISVIRRLSKETQAIECNGHYFKVKQFFKPTDCSHCREPLWGSSSLECTVCKFICHRNCKQLITISCSDWINLSFNKPMYFMAASPTDCKKWLAGLAYYRGEADKINGFGPPSPVAKTPTMGLSPRIPSNGQLTTSDSPTSPNAGSGGSASNIFAIPMSPVGKHPSTSAPPDAMNVAKPSLFKSNRQNSMRR
ncbi:hypothetical protein HK102_013395 [Quaeritorhiza haematococci]|nr:hypothetical protein HK102_013395 [Quaeritorhiza haematococci]